MEHEKTRQKRVASIAASMLFEQLWHFQGAEPPMTPPQNGPQKRGMFHTCFGHIELNSTVADATLCMFKNAAHLEVGLAAQNPLKTKIQKVESL